MVIDEREKTKKHVDEYNQIAGKHQNPDSTYFYYNRAIIIARNINYFEGELAACKGLLNSVQDDSEVYERLRYTLLLVRLYEKKGTASEKAGAYDKLGQLYFREQLYTKAIESFQKAFELENLSLAESYKAGIWLARSQRYAGEVDEALLTARKVQFEKGLTTYQQVELLKEKAEIYNELRAYDEEMKAYREIIEITKGTKFENLHPTLWNNIGYVNKYLDRNKEAKSAFIHTLKTGTKDKALLAAANYNLGLLYHNESASDSAMYCFNASEKYYTDLNDWASVASALNMKALSYYHNNDMFNGQRQLDKAFALESKHHLKYQEAKSHEIQSLFFQDLYDFENALDSYKRFLSIRDSLKTIERAEEYKLLYDQYRAEQIEKQLRLIWASNELEMANLAKKQADLAAQAERDARILRENELEISSLRLRKAKDREELQRLQLEEERLNVENKQNELDLAQRDNELKELALKSERLLVAKNKQEIENLEREKQLEAQKRLIAQQDFNYKLRLIIGALLFILIILLGILIAYRQLRRRKKQIEAQSLIIAESKKEIELQKEKSDGLLLNILPFSIAEELKRNGVAKPKLYDEVSVGFTDFSGFTMISERLTPEQLVEKLDSMFLEFDKIIEKYGLQRIKTIGDAYMFAAGLPEPLEDHAIRSVNAAIDMRDFIDEFNSKLAPDEPKWNIRIGVHSGPVVAGVIGIKKFAYDIWGDTVNTAARMESSGEVGKVNISGTTYMDIRDEFLTVHRGKVAAKNKGDIDMYFVERL